VVADGHAIESGLTGYPHLLGVLGKALPERSTGRMLGVEEQRELHARLVAFTRTSGA
jgi:hypothetical protein